MDSDKYSEALMQGMGLATVFWFFIMLMVADCVYDHGKHVGKLEAAAPELATEKEAE